MVRFLFSRRWLGLFILVICLAVGCGLLSRWQWHRREQRLAANHLIESNYDQHPVPLSALVPEPSAAVPKSLTWRPVEISGHYLTDATLLVRNRPLNSAAGFYVLVPFADDDGDVLLVNRGWVPTGETGERPDSVPAPPSGEVTIVARLQLPENDSDQQAPRGQAYRIVPTRLAGELSRLSGGAVEDSNLVAHAYGQLASEAPAPASAPVTLPEPELDEGPHLSYAIQWVIFGVGGFAGFLILVRRTLEDERADEAERTAQSAGAGSTPPDTSAVTPKPAPRRRTRRRPTDEEMEDAQLDAQHFHSVDGRNPTGDSRNERIG